VEVNVDDVEAETSDSRHIDRRVLIKRVGAATGVAWAGPLVVSSSAQAATGSQAPRCPAGGPSSGTNLIVDGGAESDTGATDNSVHPPSSGAWTVTGSASVDRYGFNDNPSTADPAKGNNYFYGGPANSSSSLAQTIAGLDQNTVARIDANCANFTLSGWIGGFDGQDDNTVVTATFRNATNTPLSSAHIGPVSSADRGGVTSLLFRSTGGSVPAGTRSIAILVQFTRAAGSDNDGLADSLSLVLS
jgi:hypothetical protein